MQKLSFFIFKKIEEEETQTSYLPRKSLLLREEKRQTRQNKNISRREEKEKRHSETFSRNILGREKKKEALKAPPFFGLHLTPCNICCNKTEGKEETAGHGRAGHDRKKKEEGKAETGHTFLAKLSSLPTSILSRRENGRKEGLFGHRKKKRSLKKGKRKASIIINSNHHHHHQTRQKKKKTGICAHLSHQQSSHLSAIYPIGCRVCWAFLLNGSFWFCSLSLRLSAWWRFSSIIKRRERAFLSYLIKQSLGIFFSFRSSSVSAPTAAASSFFSGDRLSRCFHHLWRNILRDMARRACTRVARQRCSRRNINARNAFNSKQGA